MPVGVVSNTHLVDVSLEDDLRQWLGKWISDVIGCIYSLHDDVASSNDFSDQVESPLNVFRLAV